MLFKKLRMVFDGVSPSWLAAGASLSSEPKAPEYDPAQPLLFSGVDLTVLLELGCTFT